MKGFVTRSSCEGGRGEGVSMGWYKGKGLKGEGVMVRLAGREELKRTCVSWREVESSDEKGSTEKKKDLFGINEAKVGRERRVFGEKMLHVAHNAWGERERERQKQVGEEEYEV